MDSRARRSTLAGLLVLTLSACSAGDGTNEQAASSPVAAAVPGVVAVGAGGVQELTIQVSDDYVFTPATVTVAPGPAVEGSAAEVPVEGLSSGVVAVLEGQQGPSW